jgi:hypothetical protein
VVPALPWAEDEARPAPPFVVWDGPWAVGLAVIPGRFARGKAQPMVSLSPASTSVVSTSAAPEPVSASISDSVRPEALRRRAVW